MNLRKQSISFGFVVALLGPGCDSSVHWEGSIEYTNGYKVITNTGYGLFDELGTAESLRIVAVYDDSTLQQSIQFGLVSWLEFDDDNNLFILDRMSETVAKLSPNGILLRVFAGKGKGPGELLGCSYFVMVDDTLYFANSDNGRIEVFDGDGKLLRMIQLEDCARPFRIHYHSGYFYVGEHHLRSGIFTLYQYDRNWRLTAKLIPVQHLEHAYDALRLLARTRAANDGIWFVYMLDNKIRKFGWDGTLMFETSRLLDWSFQKDSDDRIVPEYPVHRACDVDPAGNLYVTYSTPGRWRTGNEVYKYAPDGRLYGRAFVLPIDRATLLRFDRDGLLYFSDGGSVYKAEIVTASRNSVGD